LAPAERPGGGFGVGGVGPKTPLGTHAKTGGHQRQEIGRAGVRRLFLRRLLQTVLQ